MIFPVISYDIATMKIINYNISLEISFLSSLSYVSQYSLLFFINTVD